MAHIGFKWVREKRPGRSDPGFYKAKWKDLKLRTVRPGPYIDWKGEKLDPKAEIDFEGPGSVDYVLNPDKKYFKKWDGWRIAGKGPKRPKITSSVEGNASVLDYAEPELLQSW